MVEIANITPSPLVSGDKAIINRSGVPATVELYQLFEERQPASNILDNTTASFTTGYEALINAHLPPPGSASTTLIIENRTSDPGAPATGQIWIRTDL